MESLTKYHVTSYLQKGSIKCICMGFELIETRYISGKGTIQIPFDKSSYRALKLYVDVIRRPKNIYLNYQWNPVKSFYANFNFCLGEHVIRSQAIYFDHEIIELVPDYSGQNLFALKCAFRETLIGLSIIGDAVGVSAVADLEPLVDFASLKIDWDNIKVQCYADSALALRLYRLEYKVCEPSDDREEPPGEPPPALPPVPPGTPLSGDNYPISPPYQDGDTVPFPDDEQDDNDLPHGETCVKYRITWKADYLQEGASQIGYEQTLTVYGEIESLESVPSPPGFNPSYQIAIVCRGIVELGQECGELTESIVTNLLTFDGIENLEIVDIQEVP